MQKHILLCITHGSILSEFYISFLPLYTEILYNIQKKRSNTYLGKDDMINIQFFRKGTLFQNCSTKPKITGAAVPAAE